MNIKIIKNIIISCLSLVFLFILTNQTLAAGTYNFVENSGLKATASTSGYVTTGASTIEDIIGTIIYIVLGLVGVVFMGLVIYGAVTWMTAQGNDEKAKKAMKILMSALFGLIITLAAYVLTYFLISYFWPKV